MAAIFFCLMPHFTVMFRTRRLDLNVQIKTKMGLKLKLKNVPSNNETKVIMPFCHISNSLFRIIFLFPDLDFRSLLLSKPYSPIFG